MRGWIWTAAAATAATVVSAAWTMAERVWAADHAQVRSALKEAMKQSAERRGAGDLDGSIRALRDAAGEAIDALGDGSDPARTLRRSIEESDALNDPSERLRRLSFGVTEAAAAIDFRPIMEAPLPEGFPAPGPVGEVVVKEYPAYRAARAPMRAPGGGEGRAFNQLFRHITTHDVKMTAPVEMTFDASRSSMQTMAFLYERPGQGTAGQSGAVEVIDLPATTVVSVGIRGRSEGDALDDAARRLESWLAEHAGTWEAAGAPRLMGYNSPFILPYLRFSELQIPVRRAQG